MLASVPASPAIPFGDLIPKSFKAVLSRVLAPGGPQSPAQPQNPAQAEHSAGAAVAEDERLRQQIERLRRIQKPSE